MDAADQRAISKLWERFVSGIEVDLSSLRPEIADSWRRSRAAQVSPNQVKAPQASNAFSPRDEDLIQSGGPVVSFLLKALVGKGTLINLTNRDSRMLMGVGGPRALNEASRINAMPGGVWDERSAGTNVVGTGMFYGKPIEVRWQEHYVREWQRWACCSAPILHPFQNEIIGTVAISGLRAPVHPHTLELAVHAAQLIGDLVGKLESQRRLMLNNAFQDFLRRYPDAPVLAVDALGYVVQMNGRAGWLLGKQAVQVGQRLPELNGLGSGNAPDQPYERTLSLADREAKVTVHPVPHDARLLGSVVLMTAPKAACSAHPSKQEWTTHFSFASILGESGSLKQAVYTAHSAAATDYPILLIGESGTGKELFAHAIHDASGRRERPFVAFNCGTLSPELAVAEMCGYEPGAFTGADRRTRNGVLDMAHGGTLFLDELQDMAPKAQSLLLRFLETGAFVRVGGTHPIKADVRVIAASNIALAELEGQRVVRPDLLYRLNCITIVIPPLRERPGDIRLIGEHCLRKDLHFTGSVDDAVWTVLQQCQWPGNVRELRNVLLRATLVCARAHLTLAELPCDLLRGGEREPEARHDGSRTDAAQLAAALRDAGGNVREAARRLGIHWTTLYRRLARCGVKAD